MTRVNSGPTVASDRPYTPSVRIGPLVAVSGQCGYHADRSLADGLEAQIHAAMTNLEAALRDQGAGLADVLSVDVYLDTGDHFDAMNSVYIEYFDMPRPARTTVAAGLRPGVLFEISALAMTQEPREA